MNFCSRRLNTTQLNKAIGDFKSLGICPSKCRDAILELVARSVVTTDDATEASKLKLDLLEVPIDGLCDLVAEHAEREYEEHWRSVFRQLFGDKSPRYRHHVRSEIRPYLDLCLSVYAFVYPETASHWFKPTSATENTHRYLAAHRRISRIRQRITFVPESGGPTIQPRRAAKKT